MNKPNPQDFAYKKERLRAYMQQNGFDAAILARRDSFTWFTFGGDNKIFYNTDTGFGLLAVTMDAVYLIAQVMDIDRIYDDELYGLDIEKIGIRWYDPSREDTALKLLSGKRIVSDIPLAGAECRFKEIVALQTPYTPWEIARYREVGRMCDAMLKDIADSVRPSMREQDIAGMILHEYAKVYSVPKVLLVGSDDRIAKYRHPNPSNKRVERVVLLHPAADIFGMHANITRMLCFGEPPKELVQKYDLLNNILAMTCAHLRPGARYDALLHERRRMLKEAGMEQEYYNHYPGATTGYYFGSSQPIIDNEEIVDTQCFDWFLTVTGAKVEELVMATPNGGEVLSAAGVWPLKRYVYGDFSVNLPALYIRE
ncbi:MAG: M24 family metallopeptidase [Christensenellales bacterium]|jgi:Xaa-Pro dipeptidase